MTGLVGRNVLITGAGTGLGAAIAREFARAGARLVLAGRRSGPLEAEAASITQGGGTALVYSCDVSDYDAVAAMTESAAKELGSIDILINNAGIIEPIALLAEADPAAWAGNVTVNLIGAFHCVRATLPGMLARGWGIIVNISSGAAHRPLEGWSSYCAGKAGLAMLTRSIALEYGKQGIRAYGFAPGMIDTDMQSKIRASGVNPISQIPRQDLRSPSEPARAALYLCSEAAEDLAGQELSINDDGLMQRVRRALA